MTTLIDRLTATSVRARAADSVPEETHYRDTGCEVSPSCLRCPLPACVYDQPVADRHAARRDRDAEIRRLYHERGADVTGLAKRFGVSRRTIHRALADDRAPAQLAGHSR